MDIGTIIGYAAIALLFWFFVNHIIKMWFRRDEGTEHEANLNIIGRRGPLSGGDFDPNTISKIERMLKEQANSGSSEA
jgi:hypothetical protein